MSGVLSTSTTAVGAVRTGVVKVLVDGVPFRVKGAVDWDLGEDEATEIMGQDGVHGFKYTPVAAYAECVVTDGNDYDLKQILNANDVTVTIQQNNGKTVTFTNCTRTGSGKVNSEESEITLRWTSLNKGIEK